MITLHDYLVGVLLIAWVWGGCLAVGVLLVRAFADELAGSTRLAATGILATGALIVVHVVPGMLTILTSGVVAVTTGLALLGSWLLVRRRHGLRSDREITTAPSSNPLSAAFAALALVAIAGRAIANVWASRLFPPNEVDLNGIHLPTVARWIQTQSIWGNHEFSPFFAAGNYTQNVDITYLSTLLPLHQDVFARASVLPWYGLLGIVVYAFARELQAARSTAALVAAAVLSMRIVGSTAIVYGLADAQTLAGLAAGALFLVRHRRTNAGSDLTIAGIALGIAFGGKWYGVAGAGIVVLSWLVVRAWNTRPVIRIARDGAHVLSFIALLGGVWLLRNWVTTGDPLFPLSVHPLGISVWTAPPDPVRVAFGGTISDYFSNHDVLRHTLVPAWHKAFGTPGAMLFGLGILATLFWLYLARRKQSPPAGVAIALIAAALIAAIYTVTPYSALGPPGSPQGDVVFGNSRYVVGALVLLAPVGAWLLSRLPGLVRLGLELITAVFVVTATRHSLSDPLSLPASTHTVVFTLLVIAGLAVILAGRVVIPRRMLSAAAVATAVLAAAFVGVVGRRAERAESVHRYATEPAIAALQIVPGHQTLGLAGSWDTTGIQMTYPAFGPRLATRVKYIGRFVDGGLRPDTHEGFVKALRSGRYDILAIGKYHLPVSPVLPLVAWAREAGWKIAISDPRTTLMLPN